MLFCLTLAKAQTAPAFITDGLVAYYPFNGNANDQSGSDNHGVGSNLAIAADRHGITGQSFAFNGTNSMITVPNSASLEPLSKLTVSAWIRQNGPGKPPYGMNIIGKVSDSGPVSWDLSVVPTGRLRPHAHVGIWSYFDCQTSLPAGVWHHVVMTFDGSQIRGFVNGTLDGTMALNGTVTATKQPVRIGVYSETIPSGDSLFFDGTIDDVRIYNRALSATEVGELYAFESSPASPISRRATAVAQVVNGFVVGATMTDVGSGYTNSPAVTITGGNGSGATATATVVNGVVTGITIINPGTGYTGTPTVSIASPPFTPELQVAVSRVNVTLKVVLGLKYLLESSPDMQTWTAVGQPFVAESEEITQEFIVAETGQFFRITHVP